MSSQHLEKAQELMAKGEYSKAINFYTLAIKSDSSSSKLYSSRAKAYYLHLRSSGNTSQSQWKKVTDDCSTALGLEKSNYDAMYYNALSQIYGYKKLPKGLKMLELAYNASVVRTKSYKQYTLPQEIY